MNTDKIYAEAIANEYSVKKNSKVVALRKLDHKAKMPSLIFGFSFGIVSSLILGIGMCLAMGVIGSGTGVVFALGIIIGIIGIVGVCINYQIYKKILEAGKKKYSGEIIQLATEISSENK